MTEGETGQSRGPERFEVPPEFKRAYRRARREEWRQALQWIEAQIAYAEESGLGPLLISLQAAKREAERGMASVRVEAVDG